jgi:hypothetical protein
MNTATTISIDHINWSLRDSKKNVIRGTEGRATSKDGVNLLQLAVDKHRSNRDLTIFIQMSKESAEVCQARLKELDMELYGPYKNIRGFAWILGNPKGEQVPPAVVDVSEVK